MVHLGRSLLRLTYTTRPTRPSHHMGNTTTITSPSSNSTWSSSIGHSNSCTIAKKNATFREVMPHFAVRGVAADELPHGSRGGVHLLCQISEPRMNELCSFTATDE
jgi:deferrochelatase/peroxidase EfeB